MNNNPVQKAINIAGNQRELAKRSGVAQQTISKWLKRGRVPFRSVTLVVNAVGGQIPADELCPDIKKVLNTASDSI